MRWHDTCTRVLSVLVVSDNGRNTTKGRSQETKEQKGMGGRRTGYRKREVVTTLCPPPLYVMVGYSKKRIEKIIQENFF